MSFSQFYINVKRIHIAHYYTFKPENRCSYPNGRGKYGLIYVIKGNAEYRFLSGEKLTVSQGDVMFFSPEAKYTALTNSEFEHFTVNFDIHLNSSQLDILNKTYCVLKNNTATMEHGFKKLVTTWQNKNAGYEMISTSILYELLSLFHLHYREGQVTNNYQRLVLAKEYIEKNFFEEINLGKLAWLSNMSVSNFRREWKKIFKEPPIQYRDSIRIYYAKEYLQSGYYNIAEVAKKCGFDDVSYFVRFFKKKTGTTPGTLKKQCLKM